MRQGNGDGYEMGVKSSNRQVAQAWLLDCLGEDDKLLDPAALLEMGILLIK